MRRSKLSIPVYFPIISDETREQIAQDLLQAKCDTIIFSNAELFSEGEQRLQMLQKYRHMREFFEEKGLEVVIWINTLGYNGKRNEDFQRRFADCTRIRNLAGEDTGDTICLTDPKFRAYCIQNICELAETGSKTILIDDDFTLSGRNAVTCTCERHLEQFSRLVGHTVTRDDVAALFKGIPIPLRKAYLDAQGESIYQFCRELRQVIDRQVSQDVRLGLCATYTGYDLEGSEIEEVVKILAGKNRPLLRLSGAPFWSRLAPRIEGGMNLGSVIEFLRFQESFLRNSNIECYYENDPWPRNVMLVPSSYVECYDKMLLTCGWIHRQKYLFRYTHNRELADNGYWDAHCHNMSDDETICNIFANTTPVGLLIHQTRHLVREATLPTPLKTDYFLLSACTQPRAGNFAFENSIPTTYDKKTGNPGIAFWEHARFLSEEDLRSGLILDITAAQILQERGVDVGIRELQPMPVPQCERFLDNPMDALRLEEPHGEFYRLTLAENARILSVWENTGSKDAPACYTYTNAHGAKFAVYGFNALSIRYSLPPYSHIPTALLSGRGRQIANIYQFLSGGKSLPVTCFKHPQLYIICAKKDNRMALLLCNLFFDAVINPVLNLDGEYKVTNATDRTAIGAVSKQRHMTLQTVIPAFHYLVLELTLSSNDR